MLFVYRRSMRHQVRGVKVKQEKPKHTMATVTPLVMNIFDTVFREQIDIHVHEQRKLRCNACEVRNIHPVYHKIWPP